jgi:hypothetical protein
LLGRRLVAAGCVGESMFVRRARLDGGALVDLRLLELVDPRDALLAVVVERKAVRGSLAESDPWRANGLAGVRGAVA